MIKLLLIASSCSAFAPIAPRAQPHLASPKTRIAAVAGFDEMVASMESTLGLKDTGHTEGLDVASWSSDAGSGTVTWYDESSPKFLTGVGTSTTLLSSGAESCKIAAWTG